jgi:hypothetical protein
MELAEQSPTSSAADVNKLSCAIHPIPKSLQEQLPCSPHDAYGNQEVTQRDAPPLPAGQALARRLPLPIRPGVGTDDSAQRPRRAPVQGTLEHKQIAKAHQQKTKTDSASDESG